VPNTFSPNGDGNNDYFSISLGGDYEDLRMGKWFLPILITT
jgi:hypothetical protein